MREINPEAHWNLLRNQAQETLDREPALVNLLNETVLHRTSFADGLTYPLTRKLAHQRATIDLLDKAFIEAFRNEPSILQKVVYDMIAINERDPACLNLLAPLLGSKGLQSLIGYRIAHYLWNQDRKEFALYLKNLISERFSVDIHPAAKIGCGLLLDHATGFVAGETAVIEDNVSILHEVTLGGTGKERGDRHPKIRSGVLLGAGAKILGNVEIGRGARIGAGSVVLKDVSPHTSVAGVPAVVIGKTSESSPALDMCHQLD